MVSLTDTLSAVCSSVVLLMDNSSVVRINNGQHRIYLSAPDNNPLLQAENWSSQRRGIQSMHPKTSSVRIKYQDTKLKKENSMETMPT